MASAHHSKRQFHGRGSLSADTTAYVQNGAPLPDFDALLADHGPKPFVLAVQADNRDMSLLPPTYYATRSEAMAAGLLLGHGRWVVANITIKVDKQRRDYEYMDRAIRKLREERNHQYDHAD